MSSQPVRFCPYCGTTLEKKIFAGKERPFCPTCGWIHFPDPKVGVAALIIQEGRILLVRRRNNPFTGKWALPAGFLDAHENPEEAVRRECLEETGLVVEVGELLNVFSGREHPRGADIMILYCARTAGGSLQPGDDADRAEFFALDALPPLAFKTTMAAIQEWKKTHPGRDETR